MINPKCSPLMTIRYVNYEWFYIFVGLDNLKEMQSLKSDINFKVSWLSSDALPAKVKATYNNAKRLQDNDLYLRPSFR